MTKYYQLFSSYYKVVGSRTEQVSAYKHRFGIINDLTVHFDLNEMSEITEAQYLRVKKLILAKLLKN